MAEKSPGPQAERETDPVSGKWAAYICTLQSVISARPRVYLYLGIVAITVRTDTTL